MPKMMANTYLLLILIILSILSSAIASADNGSDEVGGIYVAMGTVSAFGLGLVLLMIPYKYFFKYIVERISVLKKPDIAKFIRKSMHRIHRIGGILILIFGTYHGISLFNRGNIFQYIALLLLYLMVFSGIINISPKIPFKVKKKLTLPLHRYYIVLGIAILFLLIGHGLAD